MAACLAGLGPPRRGRVARNRKKTCRSTETRTRGPTIHTLRASIKLHSLLQDCVAAREKANNYNHKNNDWVFFVDQSGTAGR